MEDSDALPNEEDVITLRNIILDLLIWMINNSSKFDSKDDLSNFMKIINLLVIF